MLNRFYLMAFLYFSCTSASSMLLEGNFEEKNKEEEKRILVSVNKSMAELIKAHEVVKTMDPRAAIIGIALFDTKTLFEEKAYKILVEAFWFIPKLSKVYSLKETYEFLSPLTSLIAPFGNMLSLAIYCGDSELGKYIIEREKITANNIEEITKEICSLMRIDSSPEYVLRQLLKNYYSKHILAPSTNL
jgi:hypothetical protein